jgi:tRNA U34 5-carboxymethylaminomethyl modifying GTPase MnmE/TrmE
MYFVIVNKDDPRREVIPNEEVISDHKNTWKRYKAVKDEIDNLERKANNSTDYQVRQENFEKMIRTTNYRALKKEKKELEDTIKQFAPNKSFLYKEDIKEHIVKVKGGYELKSKHGDKNLGKYPTRAGAEKRERQVQYFKHAGK